MAKLHNHYQMDGYQFRLHRRAALVPTPQSRESSSLFGLPKHLPLWMTSSREREHLSLIGGLSFLLIYSNFLEGTRGPGQHEAFRVWWSQVLPSWRHWVSFTFDWRTNRLDQLGVPAFSILRRHFEKIAQRQVCFSIFCQTSSSTIRTLLRDQVSPWEAS